MGKGADNIYKFLTALFLCLITSSSQNAGAKAIVVDMALVLAVDVSYSVDATEFRLQMDGIAEAFRQSDIHKAIKQGIHGRIAVAVMQWSDEKSQIVGIPWVIIDSPLAAVKFAGRLYNEPRRAPQGPTATGAAMWAAGTILKAAPFQTYRRVMDISSDGRRNVGVRTRKIRDRLAADKITINGLAILNEWPTLDIYMRATIAGGPFNFVMVANDYTDYIKAIHRKLLKEITGPGVS